MGAVTSALTEVGRVLVVVMGLGEKVGWAVVVAERSAVTEDVVEAVAEAVGVRGAVAVGLDMVDGDMVAENVNDTVPVHPCARSEMFDAHGYPPKDERAHIEPLT